MTFPDRIKYRGAEYQRVVAEELTQEKLDALNDSPQVRRSAVRYYQSLSNSLDGLQSTIDSLRAIADGLQQEVTATKEALGPLEEEALLTPVSAMQNIGEQYLKMFATARKIMSLSSKAEKLKKQLQPQQQAAKETAQKMTSMLNIWLQGPGVKTDPMKMPDLPWAKKKTTKPPPQVVPYTEPSKKNEPPMVTFDPSTTDIAW
jgi:predicted RNase H-like nuclease (RuvC/YqgF family)